MITVTAGSVEMAEVK